MWIKIFENQAFETYSSTANTNEQKINILISKTYLLSGKYKNDNTISGKTHTSELRIIYTDLIESIDKKLSLQLNLKIPSALIPKNKKQDFNNELIKTISSIIQKPIQILDKQKKSIPSYELSQEEIQIVENK